MQFEISDKFRKDWGSEPSFDELMNLDGEMYRQVARRKTFKFTVNGRDYFAKIHNGVGWGEVFKNLITARLPVLGANNEYNAINALNQLGVSTMTFAAFGQRGSNLAELQSFVITESLEPAISLEDLCVDWATQKPPLTLKRVLIKKVATITRQLHTNGINHRDLYICHFLIKKVDMESGLDPAERPLYLIDLHRVQMRNKTPERWLVKDLAALYFSSMNIGFTRRDFYRFIRVYTGNDLKTELSRNKIFWVSVERKALKLWSKPIKG